MSKKKKRNAIPTLPKDFKKFMATYIEILNDTSSTSFFQDSMLIDIELLDTALKSASEEVFSKLLNEETLLASISDLEEFKEKNDSVEEGSYLASFGLTVGDSNIDASYCIPNKEGGKRQYTIFDYIGLSLSSSAIATNILDSKNTYYSDYFLESLDSILEASDIISRTRFDIYFEYTQDKFVREYMRKFKNPLISLIMQTVEEFVLDVNAKVESLLYANLDNIDYNLTRSISSDYEDVCVEELYKELDVVLSVVLETNEDLYLRVLSKIRESNGIVLDRPIDIDKFSTEYKYIDDWRELSSIANAKGYTLDRCAGDHGIFINGDGKMVVIPQGRSIGKGLSLKIQKRLDGVELVD